MKTLNWIILGALALIIIGVAFYFLHPQSSLNGNPSVVQDTRTLKTYYDPRYGIAFNFPDSYTVQEHDSSEGVKLHSINIIDKTALANTPKDGEGPPSISINIFDNPSKLATEKWITTTGASNYNISQNAKLATSTVAGIPALAYGWDGLYHGTSLVFPDNGKMYMMSVLYNSPADQIFKDFAGIVASIQFDQ